MRVKTVALVAAAAFASVATAQAREDVRAVSSSRVLPFAEKVAKEYANKTAQKVQVAPARAFDFSEFCAGAGRTHPHILVSPRRQKKSELEKCRSNGVREIVEVKFGSGAIVLAGGGEGREFGLALQDLYLALAAEVPGKDSSDNKCNFIKNPHRTWKDVNKDLPGVNIRVLGPPPSSEPRGAFADIAMRASARQVPCMKALEKSDEDAFRARAQTIREDGAWVDDGGEENRLRELQRAPESLGVFAFSYAYANRDKIKPVKIEGVKPGPGTIGAGDYPLSRAYHLYLKKASAGTNPAVRGFALEFTSEAAWGPGGYLERLGLVPLPDGQREEYRMMAENMTPYSQ